MQFYWILLVTTMVCTNGKQIFNYHKNDTDDNSNNNLKDTNNNNNDNFIQVRDCKA